MKGFKLTTYTLSLFLVVYFFVGLFDQFKSSDDFYPFSDWYLYSFVNQHGTIYDIKYNKDGSTYGLRKTTEGMERKNLAERLHSVKKLVRQRKIEEAKELCKKILAPYQNTGEAKLVSVYIERLSYHEKDLVEREEDVFTIKF